MGHFENGGDSNGSGATRLSNLHGVLEEGKLRIAELAEEAQSICDEHWNWHYRENASRKPREKARLIAWVRHRKGGLEISWAHFRFVKKEGDVVSKPRNNHISKGRDHKYRTHSLAVHAKDWEIDHVLEIEERLAEIRAEYAHVRKMISSAKMAIKRAEKRPRVAPKVLSHEGEEVPE